MVSCSSLLHRVEHTAQMRLHCLHRAGFIVSQNAAYEYLVFLFVRSRKRPNGVLAKM